MKSSMSVVSFASKRIHPCTWYVKQLKGACQELTFGGNPQQHYKLKRMGDCYLHGTSRDIAYPTLVV